MPNAFIGNIINIYLFDAFDTFPAVLSLNLETGREGLVLGHLKLPKMAGKFTLSEHFIHIRVHTCTSALLESIVLSCYDICILLQQVEV